MFSGWEQYDIIVVISTNPNLGTPSPMMRANLGDPLANVLMDSLQICGSTD